MGMMCYFDLFLKATQQRNELNKNKLAKWCPSAVAKPAVSLVGSGHAVLVLHGKKSDLNIFVVFRMFGLIKITLQLGLFHLSYNSQVNLEVSSITPECKVISF